VSGLDAVAILILGLDAGILIGALMQQRLFHIPTVWSRGFAHGSRLHHRTYCVKFGAQVADHDEHKPDTMPEADWIEAGR
jgi:hypothetical protein